MKGRHLVLGAAILWGTTGSAQALAPEGASPLTVGALRLLMGAAGLVSVAAASGTLRRVRRAPPGALVLTALGIAAYQPAFFVGVERAGVAVGTVVAIGSAPILAGLVDRLAGGNRPRRRWMTATAFGVVGTAAVAGAPQAVDPRGLVAALGAGGAYALYAFGAKRLVSTIGSTAAMAAGFGLGAMALLPLVAASDLGWVASARGAAVVGWLGLVTVTASYLLFGAGLATTPVSTAATLSLAEPVTATLLGVLLFAERPGVVVWMGVVLILTGLGLLATRPPRASD